MGRRYHGRMSTFGLGRKRDFLVRRVIVTSLTDGSGRPHYIILNNDCERMNAEPLPATWDAIETWEIHYWCALDILEVHWMRSQSFAEHAPESNTFQEFICWRRLSVIWACSTIEAFINTEGTVWLGEDFYKDNLERLTTRQKIYTLYAFKYHARLPRKLERLGHVDRLFQLRNSLVHPKTREVRKEVTRQDSDTYELYTMEFEHLRKVIRTVTNLFEPDGIGEARKEDPS